jgi:hypothetical protein
MSQQRLLSDFFTQRNSQNSPGTTPQMTSQTPQLQVPPQNQTNPQILQTVLPQALIKIIHELASKYAALFCNSINLTDRISSLQRHREEGTIPPHLTYKANNLFTKENESNLRSTMITAFIDTELTDLQSKLMDIRSKFDNRLQDLEQTITNPLVQCEITVSTDDIVTLFNSTIQNRKLEYILKQNKDKQKKQAKRERFLATKESNNSIATLTNRQVSKFEKEISELKSKFNKINISKSKSKSNNKPKSKPTSKPKNNRSKNGPGGQARSDGKKKRKNGRKPDSTRNN